MMCDSAFLYEPRDDSHGQFWVPPGGYKRFIPGEVDWMIRATIALMPPSAQPLALEDLPVDPKLSVRICDNAS